METIIGKTIRDTRMTIDNRSFVQCTLINCTLEYSGEPVSFHTSRLSQCKYVFLGPAKRTVIFLQETGLMPFDPAEWGEFEAGPGTGLEDGEAGRDQRHNDGHDGHDGSGRPG